MRTVPASTIRQSQGAPGQQAAQRFVEGVGRRAATPARRPAGRRAQQRDVGLDGQIDQGFGVGLWRYRESPARVSGLSAIREREQAQSAEGRAQRSCHGTRSIQR